MSHPGPTEQASRRIALLRCLLLLAWAAVSFGTTFFARDLAFDIGSWPFGYWMAAQGALIAFILIVAGYTWAMNRLAPEDARPDGDAGD